MTQLMFDPDEGDRQGQEGMSKAMRALRVQAWKLKAADWLTTVSRFRDFTADDLVAAIGLPDIGPNRNNVVGALFSAWSRRGLVLWTGRYAKSERVVRHGNNNRVWRRV